MTKRLPYASILNPYREAYIPYSPSLSTPLTRRLPSPRPPLRSRIASLNLFGRVLDDGGRVICRVHSLETRIW
jgi:hypothetical protein